jgi:hypothetical protein
VATAGRLLRLLHLDDGVVVLQTLENDGGCGCYQGTKCRQLNCQGGRVVTAGRPPLLLLQQQMVLRLSCHMQTAALIGSR